MTEAVRKHLAQRSKQAGQPPKGRIRKPMSNSLLRRLLNPAYVIRHRARIAPYLRRWTEDHYLDARARGLPFSQSRQILAERQAELAALRNTYRGRRCFVIGTGPSLRVDDLDRLKDELTIASNKIYLAFDQTEWRPTFLTVSDLLVARNNSQAISALPIKKIVDVRFRSLFSDDDNFLYYSPSPASKLDGNPMPFSERFDRTVTGGYTVTYINLQLAHFLGCREIYMIGVDFDYQLPRTRKDSHEFGQVMISKNEHNHFVPNYRMDGEPWSHPRLDLQRLSFIQARDQLTPKGCRILNASRRSKLDVFPRADFDELMKTS